MSTNTTPTYETAIYTDPMSGEQFYVEVNVFADRVQGVCYPLEAWLNGERNGNLFQVSRRNYTANAKLHPSVTHNHYCPKRRSCTDNQVHNSECDTCTAYRTCQYSTAQFKG